MKRDLLPIVLPVGLSLVCGLTLVLWIMQSEATGLERREPKASAKPDQRSVGPVPESRNTGTLIRGTGQPAEDAGSWPQFRGPDRTAIAAAEKGLPRTWPAEGPTVLWRIAVGEGHAGATIHDGRVYLIDYDHEKQEDAIRCLSLADGEEIWRYTYYVRVKRNHGMSRTVPAVTDDHVVALGPKCHVTCLNAKTGELIWKKDLVEEHGTIVPAWYAGQCPLIEGDATILAPGGDPLMMAVKNTPGGEILWQTPNPGGWGMTHSSVTPVDFNGSRQYVYCSTRGVVGVAADGSGKILWTKPDWKIGIAMVPSPVPIGDGRLFFTGGYNAGSVMVRLKAEGDRVVPEELFRLKATVFGSDQHTPILYRDHLFGVVPGGQLSCLDLAGKRVWASGVAHKFGLGPYLLADGLLFVLNDQKGTLSLVEATAEKYAELAKAKILEGHDAWAPLAVASGKLILRDATEMVCLQIKP